MACAECLGPVAIYRSVRCNACHRWFCRRCVDGDRNMLPVVTRMERCSICRGWLPAPAEVLAFLLGRLGSDCMRSAVARQRRTSDSLLELVSHVCEHVQQPYPVVLQAYRDAQQRTPDCDKTHDTFLKNANSPDATPSTPVAPCPDRDRVGQSPNRFCDDGGDTVAVIV